MAGVSTALSWQDVKEWMEKQEPYMLQTVLKTTTNLLATHVKKSAAEEAKPALPVGPVGPVVQYMLKSRPASEDLQSDVGQVVAEDAKPALKVGEGIRAVYAAEAAKIYWGQGDKQDGQERNEEADMECVEAKAREWQETVNGGEKTESNKVALEDHMCPEGFFCNKKSKETALGDLSRLFCYF